MTKARDIASANPAPSTVSATELGYLDGVTSAVQTQIDTKIASTLADAKGDLLVASADNTVTRLPVGSTGETIVADSSTSTGLRYNPQNALANPVINGGMDIWQRGTSVTSAGTGWIYGPDRWNTVRGGFAGGMTATRQTVSDSTNLPNIQYSLRMQRTNGNTSTQDLVFAQALETVNSIPFAGKTITMSFYARSGANYNPNNLLTSGITTGTGTDQSSDTITYNWTGGVYNQQSNTLTTTWQRFVQVLSVPATATQIGTWFRYVPTGTAGANDWYEVTGVQIDIGTYTASTAPSFRRSGGTIQGELAACQRYYWRTQINGSAGAFYNNFAPAYSPNSVGTVMLNPVPMRIGATSMDIANMNITDAVNGLISGLTITLDTAVYNTELISSINVYKAGAFTTYRSYVLRGTGSSSYIGFSAEL